jgi:hypothetical protein
MKNRLLFRNIFAIVCIQKRKSESLSNSKKSVSSSVSMENHFSRFKLTL